MILTNCLGWETLPAEAPVRFHDGLTQTPQVAIDIRLTLDSEKPAAVRGLRRAGAARRAGRSHAGGTAATHPAQLPTGRPGDRAAGTSSI
ncbi:hypothetical protein M8494_35785 [Serratia ureilytica]